MILSHVKEIFLKGLSEYKISLGLLAAVGIGVAASCGSSSSSDTANKAGPGVVKTVLVPGPTVTVTVPVTVYLTPAPSTSGTPSPVPDDKVWVASNSYRYLSSYDASGTLVKSIDLATVTTGAITGLTFMDRDNLMVFLDPGASGENFTRVNVTTGTVTPGFITDPAFTNSTVLHIAAGDSSKLYAARQAGGIERFFVSLTSGVVNKYSSPWPLASGGSCLATTYQLGVPYSYGGLAGMALFSSGTNSMINFYSTLEATPTCTAGSSNNFGTTVFPAAVGYVPVGAFYNGTNWFVRYYHATTPRIVRYAFNGLLLTSGTDVVTNAALLSTNASSRELIPLNSTQFLVPEWTNDAINIFDNTGTYVGIFAKNSFTIDVNSVTLRPPAP
jgi:hypothetical protein